MKFEKRFMWPTILVLGGLAVLTSVVAIGTMQYNSSKNTAATEEPNPPKPQKQKTAADYLSEAKSNFKKGKYEKSRDLDNAAAAKILEWFRLAKLDDIPKLEFYGYATKRGLTKRVVESIGTKAKSPTTMELVNKIKSSR